MTGWGWDQSCDVTPHLRPGHHCAHCLRPGNRDDFSAAARRRILEVMNAARVRQRLLKRTEESEDEGEEDTWVFPLVQMKPLGIQVDEQVTQVSPSRLGGSLTCWAGLDRCSSVSLTDTFFHHSLDVFNDEFIVEQTQDGEGERCGGDPQT